MPRMHEKALTFVFITLFLDIVGIGIIVPVLPALIASFVGGNESLAAKYYGPLVSTYALVQFLCAPVVGALSDRVGRRPVILLSLLGLGIDYLVLACAPSMGWLFAGRSLPSAA